MIYSTNTTKPLIVYGENGKEFAEGIYRCLAEGVNDNPPINKNFEFVGKMRLKHFADGEHDIKIGQNVNGRNVYVVQRFSPEKYKTDSDFNELKLINDAAAGSYAGRVTDVMGNMPGERQDRKKSNREPLTAKLYAEELENSGADGVMFMDLHEPQIEGFFHKRTRKLNIPGLSFYLHYIKEQNGGFDNSVITTLDAGGLKSLYDAFEKVSMELFKEIELASALKEKKYIDGELKIELTHFMGNVSGKRVFTIDDEVSSGKTIKPVIEYMMNLETPPKSIICFSTKGKQKEEGADRMDKMHRDYGVKFVFTNVVPIDPSLQGDYMEIIEVDPIYAHAISRMETKKSISDLFRFENFEKLLGGDYNF